MGLIVSLISTILCAVVYVRMYRRDLPEPIGKKKAALPAVLGFFAPILSTMAAGLFSIGAVALMGGSIQDSIHSLILRSLLGSFIIAGFTEELVKFLLFLLTVKIAKPKNVYEYGMLCAGIGFGFTALEILLYGSGNAVVALSRIPTFALHMVFGLIMGVQLGLARYSRLKGEGSRKHICLALLLPVLLHTVYDAATFSNAGIRADDDTTMKVAIVIGLVVILVSVVFQFALLIQFRKKSEAYCGMLFSESGQGQVLPDPADDVQDKNEEAL